uniref:Major facilitator superfamily associated domain-containing protein n=1 Tax=Glossina morsitans morsitans TaxID=37546 RepID=A0A1B0GG72_GLOMM
MRPNINKDLLPIKAHYFLFNAGTAPVVPFMPTLAKQLGYSSIVVGTMYTILAVIGMLTKPLVGFLSDRILIACFIAFSISRYQRHRMLFISCEILTGLAFFLITFTPGVQKPLPVVELHHDSITTVRYCSSDNCISTNLKNYFILIACFIAFSISRYQRHRMLFISCEILTGLAFFLITFTPGVQKPLPVVELHHDSITTVRYCSSDNCISTNLKNYFQNQTLTCKLHCQIEPYMWNDVCKQCFHINPENCNRSSEYVDLTRDINMNDIGIEQLTDGETCMIFTVIPSDDDLEAAESQDCLDNSTYFNTTCELNCNNEYLHSQLAQSPVINNSDAVSLYQFWWFFGMLIISWIGMAAVQRLYGSVGWGIFSILAGILVDAMSNDGEKDYTAVFWMTAIIMALDVLASLKLKHTQTHLSPNILKDVGQMFLSMRCVIFFIWCVFIGLGTALIWNFLFWHLENLSSCQDSMKTLQGFVMAIQCFCGELPFFFSSGWILKKIGHINAMSLVLFGFGVRFILYSMLQDPWYVLPIELLNGVTFGLFYATMASYASIVAPPGTETTMQGLVGAIFEGIGVSTGSFVGGLLFDSVGGGHTFEIFGVSFFIAFIVHFCIQKYLQRHQSADTNGKQTPEQNSKDSINHINNSNSATQLTKDIAPTDTADKIQNA